MNAGAWHFAALMAVSSLVFVAVLYFVLRRRPRRPAFVAVVAVAAIVNVGGMAFAKLGANSGWPVWLYYGLPAVVTVFAVPVALRMAGREAIEYVGFASLIAPAIHVSFSLLFGWKEYMPFWVIPSLGELLS